jgi:hypothetical protein
MVDEPKKDEGNLPDPVMDVLKDLQEKVNAIQKPQAEEKPAEKAPPAWVAEREAEKKAMGFTEEQMQAHERSIARAQAPVVEQSAWAGLEKRQDLDKYRKEIEDELKIYRPEAKTADLLQKIYFMVKGRHADSAPADEKKPAPKPGERVASSRVSGGPGYSGSEGGSSTEKEDLDKDAQLSEAEEITANKLGVDPKRFALSRNAGKDITSLRKTEDRPVGNGADFDLRRMQGGRR